MLLIDIMLFFFSSPKILCIYLTERAQQGEQEAEGREPNAGLDPTTEPPMSPADVML